MTVRAIMVTAVLVIAVQSFFILRDRQSLRALGRHDRDQENQIGKLADVATSQQVEIVRTQELVSGVISNQGSLLRLYVKRRQLVSAR